MSPKKDPSEIRTLKIYGLELPLTKWAISALALIAVVAVALTIYIKLLDPYIHKKLNKSSDSQLVEYQKHFSETPGWSTEVLEGKLKVSYYVTDGCLLVGRRSGPNSALIQAWVVDPGKIPREASPGPITKVASLVPELEAQNCSGGCWNPHPGEFRWWNGQQNGCWIQIWRQWSDSCTHYQWFNTCYNYWDSNPDGTPKIFWTCCVH